MTEMSPVGAVCGRMRPDGVARAGAASGQAEAGPSDLGRRAQDRRRSGQAAAARWQERPGCCTCAAPGSRRLFPRRGGLARGVRQRGLVLDRRRRDHRPGRLHADHRPGQGHGALRRRMDQLDRAGECRGRPSGRRGSGGDRRASPEMGRAAAAARRAPAGSRGRQSRDLEFLAGRVAKWWLPDDVVFVDELPHTATGKIRKSALRERFRDYVLPTA